MTSHGVIQSLTLILTLIITIAQTQTPSPPDIIPTEPSSPWTIAPTTPITILPTEPAPKPTAPSKKPTIKPSAKPKDDEKKAEKRKKAIIIGCSAGLGVLLIILLLIAFYMYWYKKKGIREYPASGRTRGKPTKRTRPIVNGSMGAVMPRHKDKPQPERIAKSLGTLGSQSSLAQSTPKDDGSSGGKLASREKSVRYTEMNSQSLSKDRFDRDQEAMFDGNPYVPMTEMVLSSDSIKSKSKSLRVNKNPNTPVVAAENAEDAGVNETGSDLVVKSTGFEPVASKTNKKKNRKRSSLDVKSSGSASSSSSSLDLKTLKNNNEKFVKSVVSGLGGSSGSNTKSVPHEKLWGSGLSVKSRSSLESSGSTASHAKPYTRPKSFSPDPDRASDVIGAKWTKSGTAIDSVKSGGAGSSASSDSKLSPYDKHAKTGSIRSDMTPPDKKSANSL